MTAAVFGLVGVIIGALLTGFVASSSAARRNRRAAQTAARLLLIDVAAAQSAYEQCLEDGAWVVLPSRPVSLEEWSQWKALLASSISGGADWKKLYTVFVDAQHFNALAATHQEGDPISQPVSDAMATALARTDEALPVLAPYARGEHLYWSRFRAWLRRLFRR
jgi:type II secretory pathway pseudopilin PulG